MKNQVALLVIAFGLIPRVSAGENCVLIQAWSDVPPSISKALTDTIGPIAQRGDDFNSSDIVFDETPRNRFFGGCRSGDKYVLAIERGGRGCYLEMFEYVGNLQVRKWSRQVPESEFTPLLAEPSNKYE